MITRAVLYLAASLAHGFLFAWLGARTATKERTMSKLIDVFAEATKENALCLRIGEQVLALSLPALDDPKPIQATDIEAIGVETTEQRVMALALALSRIVSEIIPTEQREALLKLIKDAEVGEGSAIVG